MQNASRLLQTEALHSKYQKQKFVLHCKHFCHNIIFLDIRSYSTPKALPSWAPVYISVIAERWWKIHGKNESKIETISLL